MNQNNTLFGEEEVPEKEIESTVVRYARRKGFMVEKFNSPQKRSVPDDLFTRGVFHFYIEFKRLNKLATEAQSKDHKKRRSTGQLVFVCDNIEDGKRIVDKMWEYYVSSLQHMSEI